MHAVPKLLTLESHQSSKKNNGVKGTLLPVVSMAK